MLRIGVCVIIIGLTILLANITGSGGGIGSTTFSISSNGTWFELVAPLRSGPHEIRIGAPQAFRGTVYVFNYEGMRLLTEGTKLPILEENIQGSTLIDFTINRRGAYLIMIQSNVSTQIEGSLGIVDKGRISYDLIFDSMIIITIGTAITILAITLGIPHSHRLNKATYKPSKRTAAILQLLKETGVLVVTRLLF